MKFIELPLKGAYIIESEPFTDHRGRFARIFCREELKRMGHQKEIVQVNHSMTLTKGAIRGMHFQRPPKAEIKIVKCIRGAVFDVIIDLRHGSPTMLRWHGEELLEENMKAMYIPEGFAHGFQTLKPDTELLYFHTELYSPEHEGGIIFNDPMINIHWPLPASDISEKDERYPCLTGDFQGITLS